MNDDQFEALDDRANQAARNVHAAAGRRPRPAFDADRPMTLPQPAAVGESRAPRRTAWVAAAAVVALVAGAVTFAATRPDGGKDTIAASSVEDPRPFVAEDLPDGFEPAVFMDLTRNSGPELATSSMSVYGKTAEEPLAGAIEVDAQAFDDLELTPFEVDGMTLYRAGSDEVMPGPWVVVKQSGSFVVLFGATDDAVALARAVSVVDGDLVVDADALPDGWRRLVSVEDPLSLMFKSVRSSSVKGYFSAYMPDSDGSMPEADYASIQVTSLAGDEPTMWAARLFVPDSVEVTVRGHRGFSGSYPMDTPASDDPPDGIDMKTVSWLERPGEVLSVTGINVTEEQLLEVAEGIRPATQEEWTELVQQSELGGLGGDQGPDAQLGRTTGTFDDGSNWALIVRQGQPFEVDGEPVGEGEVYTDLRVAVGSDATPGTGSTGSSGSSSSSSSGGVHAFRSVETADIADRHFSSGILGDEVASVQLQRADGTVLSDATIVEVAGFTAFVTELTEDPMVLVALRADGSEVGRVTIEDLDQNTTTDMDGDGSFSGQGTPIDNDGNPIVDPVQPTATSVPTDDTVPD